MAKSWAVGPFGLRLNFALKVGRVQAEFTLSPAEHYRMAEDHQKAARELLCAGIGLHERPEGY